MSDSHTLLDELDRLAAAAIGVSPVATTAAGPDGAVTHILAEARRNSAVNLLPPDARRLRLAKKIMVRASRLYTVRQAHYNELLADAVEELDRQLLGLRNRLARELLRLELAGASLAVTQDELGAEIEQLRSRLAAAGPFDEASGRTYGAELDALSVRQHELEQRVGSLNGGWSPIGTGGDGKPDRAEEFYQRFELALRGSADQVTATLEPYLNDLERIRTLNGPVVDVGCGRGEWLAMVAGRGMEVLGIDTNRAAVEECRRNGVDAVVGEGIEYLFGLPAGSVLAVTCFHVVEHLPPEAQVRLVEASLHALKPGGMLIIETPNPTNLNVGAASFYNDPTHLRPVNPSYLTFVVSDAGFTEVEARFQHPLDKYDPSAVDEGSLEAEMMWAMRGPQDYAVLARKPLAEVAAE